MSDRIEAVWAFVADYEDGEGVIGFCDTNIGWVPMVVGRQEAVDALRPIAQNFATQEGRSVRLVRFTTRSEVEVIQPQRPKESVQ